MTDRYIREGAKSMADNANAAGEASADEFVELVAQPIDEQAIGWVALAANDKSTNDGPNVWNDIAYDRALAEIDLEEARVQESDQPWKLYAIVPVA
jgi:hypothetical protein